MEGMLDLPVFRVVSRKAAEAGMSVYVVGGFVRDAFLRRDNKDIDFVTTGDGIALAKAVSAEMKPDGEVAFFKNFGTAMFKLMDGTEIEFVGARKESYETHSRKPNVQTGTLEDDQLRRDFTINAMAISVNEEDFGHFIDPFNGIQDLHDKIIRTPTDANITFSDDPLRMMRAIRFATQLNFTIHPDTLAAISANKERILIVSGERVADELNKIIMAPVPSVGFKLLFDTGLLQIIFPELAAMQGVESINGKRHKDNFYHTLQVLDNISPHTQDLWLRWSAILHDIAKPVTKKFEQGHGWTFHGHEDRGARMVPHIFRRLKLPLNEKMKFVQKMVQLHLRPIALSQETVTDSAVRRLIVDAGDELDALFTLCRADITSKNERKVAQFLKNFDIVRQKAADVLERDQLRNWQPPITGNHIMETFDIGDPKKIGELKNIIREAILDGEVANEFEAAYQYMLQKGREMGLKTKETVA